MCIYVVVKIECYGYTCIHTYLQVHSNLNTGITCLILSMAIIIILIFVFRHDTEFRIRYALVMIVAVVDV